MSIVNRSVLSSRHTHPYSQVPEGDQEGASGAADAEEHGVCVQPDGERFAAGPGEAHTSVRHIKVGRATVWVLRTWDAGHGRNLSAPSYHYTDMYFTILVHSILILGVGF